MSYERTNIQQMTGYSSGEQPRQAQVIKLNTNENPYPASAAVAQALAGIRVEDLRRYPQPLANGFRQVAADYHQVEVDNIIATNGGDELIRLLITTFVDPGQTIAIAEPSYSLYPVLAAIQNCPVTRIDLQETFQQKIGKSVRPYLILGACNPNYAYEALQKENKVGTMLPCNVIVQELADGSVEVAAIDPVASMAAIDNPELLALARQVSVMLQEAVLAI